MPRLTLALALTALAACADPPELDAALPPPAPAADWPRIEPLGALLDQADATGHGAEDAEANDALTARADALRGRVGG